MSPTNRMIAAATLLVAAGGAAIGLTARDGGDDEVVTLEQCPLPVQVTIMAHVGAGEVVEIERTTDHGEVLYEVDVRDAGGVIEFDVAEDGGFRGFESDTEEQAAPVELRDAPQAVRREFARVSGRARALRVERVAAGGAAAYEIEYERDGARVEVVLSEDGAVMETESSIAIVRLPAAVSTALRNAFPDAVVREAASVQVTYYEVGIERNGTTQDVVVFANGRVKAADGDDDGDDGDGGADDDGDEGPGEDDD